MGDDKKGCLNISCSFLLYHEREMMGFIRCMSKEEMGEKKKK
jgi:hypothetical protein